MFIFYIVAVRRPAVYAVCIIRVYPDSIAVLVICGGENIKLDPYLFCLGYIETLRARRLKKAAVIPALISGELSRRARDRQKFRRAVVFIPPRSIVNVSYKIRRYVNRIANAPLRCGF